MDRLRVYAGWEHGCCRGCGDGAAAAGPLQRPNSQQDTTADQCRQTARIAWQVHQHFKQLLPSPYSPATESRPETVFPVFLNHAWMQGDTAKREGGEVLLPPITPKIMCRAKELHQCGGRQRCCGQAPLAQHRQGKGSRQAAVCPSWAQPCRPKALRSLAYTARRGGWAGKFSLGKQPFPFLAWGSEIKPFFLFFERSNSSWLHGSDSCYKRKVEEGGKRLNVY